MSRNAKYLENDARCADRSISTVLLLLILCMHIIC